MTPEIDLRKRRAGAVLPVSALRSETDDGVGDFESLALFLDWLHAAGFSILQILPLNDLAPRDGSPYSPISAFALDPLYAALSGVSDLPDAPRAPKSLRAQARVRFASARAFKLRALRMAYRRFEKEELVKKTPRAAAFDAYRRAHAGWLDDYALFRILKERGHWESWRSWPGKFASRDAAALRELKESRRGDFLFHQYVQWILDSQWKRLRERARSLGILLYGDIPFGLDKQSADVWARQEDFDFSATMGAPPDQYSATGQAWGLPAYRWDKMAAEGHVWWRMRVKRAREHFDLFRLDHAVGFFRTWFLRRGAAENGFDIMDAGEQQRRGEAFFRMAQEEGAPARPIAEDLGLIPPFVYETLEGLGVPGYKITRWEGSEGGFRSPASFAPLSVATTGNHDMPSLAAWWRESPPALRSAYWRMASGEAGDAPRFSQSTLFTLLENVYHSGSAVVLFPFQDLFGARERINIPGTVRARNWTYRTPMTAQELLKDEAHRRRAARLRSLAESSGRL